MSGHVGDLSPQQEEALRKFKAAVADIQNKPEDDDYFHLRWLRARRFDVRKAELMLRNVRKLCRYIYHTHAHLHTNRQTNTLNTSSHNCHTDTHKHSHIHTHYINTHSLTHVHMHSRY